MTLSRQISGGAAYATGIEAERQTKSIVQKKGFEILAQRCRTPYGEIDLVAASGSFVLFIEVKKRRMMADAVSALRPTQQRRLLNAAAYLLQTRPSWQRENTRFDLVLHDNEGKIHWIEDVLRAW